MSAGFTPGPWFLQPHAKFGVTQMYWVNPNTSVGTEVEADANLIAAAPALYEALEAAFPIIASDYEPGAAQFQPISPTRALAMIRDALAQARGDLVDPLEQVRR